LLPGSAGNRPRYFAGTIELGTISQAAGAFNHILSDLSIIINQFETLSSFSAGIERLSAFYEAMRDVDVARNASSPLIVAVVANATMDTTLNGATLVNGSNQPPNGAEIARPLLSTRENVVIMAAADHVSYGEIELRRGMPMDGATILSVQNLDLVTPDRKRVLIRNLNVHLNQGDHLLIVGSSGAGKSSLLRAIAGLWTMGSGTIGRPHDDDVYFLPQRPYCTVGSLKDQLLYPSLDSSQKVWTNGDSGNKILPRSHWLKQTLTDDALVQILAKVDLLDVAVRAGDGDPVKGLSAVVDWSNILSLGEQQRLAFGRLLVNRPKLVIVDEATSALDLANEARMYQILQEMAKKVHQGGQLSPPGLTYISVGHRPSLVVFHNKKLRLGGEHSHHELTNVEKSSFQTPSPLEL
jgi:vitamin B12/bleomycin/antimicrobial peptide transport system ATP-binding/permease protein